MYIRYIYFQSTSMYHGRLIFSIPRLSTFLLVSAIFNQNFYILYRIFMDLIWGAMLGADAHERVV